MHIAILAPFHAIALKDGISSLPVDAPSSPRGMGGYCIASLVRERIRRGLSTDVITLDPTTSDPIMRWEGKLVRLWVVQRRPRKALRDGFRRESRLLRQALRESNPDVCHANWTYEYGLAAVTQHDYPVVLTVHDHARNCLKWLGPKYLPFFLITQYVLRRTQNITTVSPYVAAYLEKKLGREVPMIPNLLAELVWELGAAKPESMGDRIRAAGGQWSRDGVPHSPVSCLSGRQTAAIISAVNWSKLKNTKRAIQAFQIARQYCLARNVELRYTLVGAGLGPGGPAETWAKDHCCAQGILFLGTVPYEDSLRMIRASDLLFHPSMEDTMPGPLAEAMAMNTPVVACREAHGSRWLLDEGDCGLLVSGRSAAAMADGLLRILQNPDTLAPFVVKARARIRRICDQDLILGAYERVYERALNIGAN